MCNLIDKDLGEKLVIKSQALNLPSLRDLCSKSVCFLDCPGLHSLLLTTLWDCCRLWRIIFHSTANFYVTAQFPFQNKGWASPWEESEIQLGGLPQWAYLLDLVWVLSYLATGPCFQGSYFYFAFLIVLSRTVRLLSYYVAGSGNSWENWVATLWGCFWLLLVFLAKDIFIQLK